MEENPPKKRSMRLRESRRRTESKRKTHSGEERIVHEKKLESQQDRVHISCKTPSKGTKRENGCDSVCQMKRPVVVLNRLPEYKIGALRPPTPPQFYSEDESLSSSDSDMQWESEEDSSDSDYSYFNRKIKYSNSTVNDSTQLPAIPTSSYNSDSFIRDSQDTIRPDLPDEEVNVDMIVIARRRPMRWQRGKIVDIVTKDDGRLKYKIRFEDKGTCLVSGHHIAFDSRPRVEQLYIGARVVVRCQNNKYRFRPGILAELPSRKNQFRFLVFLDDHTPVYVGLPLFHLVCRPLEDPVDDVPDGPHQCFVRHYLRDWPYPQLNKYRAGQSFNVELNGVQQRCEVLVVDCSLMHVIFLENQRREWIFRGSMRLEHIAKLWESRQNKDSDSD